MQANKMNDRGDVSDALKSHMSGCEKVELRQTRRGWCQEIMGCEARNEFKYFIGDQQVFHSLEDSSCCGRVCCNPCYSYTMVIKELNTDAEIVTVERPSKCGSCCCKCCSYQEASFSSNGVPLGKIKEDCFYCVPSFHVYDASDAPMYLVHPPTCCAGVCVACCAEGNPCCGNGCCKESYRIYAPDEKQTASKDPYLGVILKKPKSLATEIFTDANAMDVDFPKNATVEQKGILMGASIFLNSLFFENEG